MSLVTVLSAGVAASPASADTDPTARVRIDGAFSVVVDRELHPDPGSIPDPHGDGNRPVGAFAGPQTRPGMFVIGEGIFSGSAEAARRYAGGLHGTVVATIMPAVRDLAPLHLIRFDPAAVEAHRVVEGLAALSPDSAHGEHRVSAQSALGTLAAAARARRAGLAVDLNWVSAAQTFRTGATADAPGQNTFTWPHLEAIGVPAAWNMLDRAGRFAPSAFHPNIAVVDSGYSNPDPDRPTGGFAPAPGPNPVPCSGGNPCPFHASDVSNVLMAVPDNGFGGAGPAGPVAVPLQYDRGGTVFTDMDAYLDAVGAGARVINMSFAGSVPAAAATFLGGYDAVTASVRNAGVLQLAAAGNDGADVDTIHCFVACWEADYVYPCENTGVICVGGLSGTVPATNSNFGSGGLNPANSVDVWAPFCALAGPNDGMPGNAVHRVCGTSFAAPLASGVTGMLLAAGNGAPATAVESTLLSTATGGGCLSQGRCAGRIVNASAGVNQLLGNLPPDLSIRATTPTNVPRGKPISFTATASDPEGGPLAISWLIDGVRFAAGPTLTYNFVEHDFGGHTVTATVDDGTWSVGDAGRGVPVVVTNTAPVMTLTRPGDGLTIINPYGQHVPCYFKDKVLICPDNVDLSATSFDQNNWFTSLPDQDVTWWFDGNQVATGHQAVIRASTLPLGAHTVKVTGTDGQLTGEASVSVTVAHPRCPCPALVS